MKTLPLFLLLVAACDAPPCAFDDGHANVTAATASSPACETAAQGVRDVGTVDIDRGAVLGSPLVVTACSSDGAEGYIVVMLPTYESVGLTQVKTGSCMVRIDVASP